MSQRNGRIKIPQRPRDEAWYKQLAIIREAAERIRDSGNGEDKEASDAASEQEPPATDGPAEEPANDPPRPDRERQLPKPRTLSPEWDDDDFKRW